MRYPLFPLFQNLDLLSDGRHPVVYFLGLRFEIEGKVIAFSGDTEWTDALLPIADGADLFICECYELARPTTGHMSWNHLQARLPLLRARRIMITHMSASVLARLDEVRGSGVLVAEDGLVVEV